MTTDTKVPETTNSTPRTPDPVSFGGPKAHPLDERVRLPDGTVGTRGEFLDWDRSR